SPLQARKETQEPAQQTSGANPIRGGRQKGEIVTNLENPPLEPSGGDTAHHQNPPLVARYHITVHGADRAAMADLVRVHGVRVYAQTLQEGSGGYRVDAVCDESEIDKLTDAGYRVDRHEDVD